MSFDYTGYTPEAKEARDQSLEDVSAMLAFMVKGWTASTVKDYEETDRLARRTADYLQDIGDARCRNLSFTLCDLLLDELVAKHGGLAEVVAVAENPDGVLFVGEERS